MTPAEEITLGEISRRLKRLEEKLDERVVYREVHDAQVSAINEAIVAARVYLEAQDRSTKDEVNKISENQTWFGRALILQFVALLVAIAWRASW